VLWSSLATAIVAAFPASTNAAAEADISQFAVTPSTTQAGGHPNLEVSVSFGVPTSRVSGLALHLPAGLTATPDAIPFCSRKRLLADLCPSKSKAGSITAAGEAFGFQLTITKTIFNVRPAGSERLRLAVPLFGSFSRPGIAAELPVTERPQDRGLDMAVVGLPQQVNGFEVRLERVSLRIKGTVRIKVKKKRRTRPFLTNPLNCSPALSVLDVTLRDAPTATTRTSAFTPTGCLPG
jgi:hypothetical protein